MDDSQPRPTGAIDITRRSDGAKESRRSLGFAAKVILLSVLVAGGTALVFSAIHTRSIADLAEQKSLDSLKSGTALLVPYVRDAFDDMRQDLQMIALTQAATGIVRASENGGVDPQSGSSFDDLRQRLTRLFAFMLRARPGYTQIRYIGLDDDGREIVRVDRVGGSPFVVPEADLQRKGHRDYFSAALDLRPGEFAFSAIDRNMEHGRVSADARITLRAVTAIHNTAGEPLGVVVINDDYVGLLNRIAAAAQLPADVYIIDGSGNSYVASTNGEVEFFFAGDEADSHRRRIAASLRSAERASGLLTKAEAEATSIVSYATVLPAGPGGQPLRVGLAMDRATLFKEAKATELINMLLAAGLILLAGLVGLLAGRALVRPIVRLRTALADYASTGDLDGLPTVRHDEIGDFARSFESFAQQLAASRSAEHRAFVHLDATLQNSIDGIVTLDRSGLIRRMNPASCEMFAVSPEEAVGRHFGSLLLEKGLAEFDSLFRAVLEGRGSGSEQIREFVGVTRQGNPVDIEVSMSLVPLPDDDPIVSVVLRNIASRKAAEQKLRQFSKELEASNRQLVAANDKLTSVNQDLRGFTYIVSHDLRAPLINLIGFSARLTELIDRLKSDINEQLPESLSAQAAALIDDRIPTALDFINSAGGKMQQQLDVILRLSRLGRYDMKPRTVSLARLFADEVAIHERDDAIRVELDEVPDVVMDLEAARIIARNLVSNAVKYGDPERSPDIRISAEWDEDHLTLCVADNGRGIRSEDLEEVFKLFRRVGRQDTLGEGVGLAFVHRVVERIGGSIRCESELGVGSRFYVKIPRRAAAYPLTEAA